MPISSSPSDEELKPVIQSLRTSNPSLGIGKFHTLLVKEQPGWCVSEKRIRRVLVDLGMWNPNNGGSNDNGNTTTNGNTAKEQKYPKSKLNASLKIENWTTKVIVKHFGKAKGKGLIAKEVIEAGEEIWREDPFIVSPEWELFDAQQSSVSCTHCTTPLIPPSPLHKSCARSSSSPPCPARFCSLICRSKALSTIHPILCPGTNKSIGEFWRWVRREEWMALSALVMCIAKVVMANDKGEEELRECKGFLEGLAEMSLEKRCENVGAKVDHELWRMGFEQVQNAIRKPIEEGALSRVVKKPISQELVPELYDYDAFLRGLGRMSLNLESHGGLYTLHSHLNHSCEPNIGIRHLHQRVSLARITAVARRKIEVGEELVITYVNPNIGVQARRRALKEWNWGDCMCERCVREAKLVNSILKTSKGKGIAVVGKNGVGAEGEEMGVEGEGEDEEVQAPKLRDDVDPVELEKELKEALGY